MRKDPRDEEAGAGAHATPSVPPETISDGVKLLRTIPLFTQKCSPVSSESADSATLCAAFKGFGGQFNGSGSH